MEINKLYYQLKEAWKFRLDMMREALLEMETGKVDLVVENEKIQVSVFKEFVILHIDLTKKINEDTFRNTLSILFNRKIIIKRTFNGYIIPKDFFYTKQGMSIKRVKKEKFEGEYIQIESIENISNKWLFVISDVHSKESDTYQYEVLSVDPYTNEKIKKLCNKETLCRYSPCINFLSSSMSVNLEEGKRNDYTRFFFEFIRENGHKLEKKDTIPTLGWNSELTGFVPYSQKLHLDYSSDKYNFLKNVVNAFESNSFKLKEFKERLLKHVENPFADFIVSCSFAAPLLKVVGVRSFLVNCYGASKTQKSLSARIALSIFGKYSNLEMSGSDTINVIKSKIHKLQNLLVYIDEIVQQGKKYNTVINGYDFGNERDRHRLDKNSEIKEAKTWRTIGICTSESPIQKDTDMEGENSRSFCLRVDCRPEALKNDDSACHKYAADYYRFLEHNYGLIGKRYVEEIARLNKADVLIKWYEKINAKLYEYNQNKNLTDHISYISVVCLGNYIYRRLLYQLDDIYYSIDLGIKILSHLSSRAELNSDRKYVNAIYEFYEINKVNFSIRGESSAIVRNQVFGTVDTERNEIIFILGPLKEHLLKNGFDWNYKTTLVINKSIKYCTRKVNNIPGKRIVVPFFRKTDEEDLEEEYILNEIASKKESS